MDYTLKPCPFCGGKEATLTSSTGAAAGWYVLCGKPHSVYEPLDGCGVQTKLRQTRDIAVDDWNKRAKE